MKTILLLGLLTGLDNLQVTPALGVMRLTTRQRLFLALMFGLAEALMPLVGLWAGSSLRDSVEGWADYVGPVVMLLCGGGIIALSLRAADLKPIFTSKWTLVLLPLSLSIDNLLAGVGLGASGAPLLLSALVVGGISAAMSLAGLYAGQFVRGWLPRRAELFSGAYLVAFGLGGLVWNSLT